MSLSIYMKGVYEDFNAFGRQKNKPNSKPNKLVPSASSGQALSAVEWSQSYLAPSFIWGLKNLI